MAKKTEQAEGTVAVAEAPKDSTKELVQALVEAIQLTRPVQKKTSANRKPVTPWTPKNGEEKLKLKRTFYQHSITVDPDYLTNAEIALVNKLKPGRFMDNWVKVVKRRDGGMNLEYPVKTASQRLQLVNRWGIRNLSELLERCILEANNPLQYKVPEDLD